MMDAPARLSAAHVVQREIGRVLALLWTPAAAFVLRVWLGYRIEGLPAVREKFRNIRRASSAPLLICANHLTMIDSFLVAWALAPTSAYVLHYDRLPWNVPERKNFASNPWQSFLAYVAKCIPITRGGSRADVAAVLERITRLLANGETALLFPEGGRSRTSRVETDAAAWGVGRIVGGLPGCRVLCVYLRGRKQESWGQRPARGDRIDIDIECIEPKSDCRGARRSRDLSRQIIGRLAAMERKYFDGRE